MIYAVSISPRAIRDADRLETWLRARDPSAATRLGAQLEQAITHLSEYPLRGRAVGATVREAHLSFGQGVYVIRYRVTGRHVIITRIWHGLEQR